MKDIFIIDHINLIEPQSNNKDYVENQFEKIRELHRVLVLKIEDHELYMNEILNYVNKSVLENEK